MDQLPTIPLGKEMSVATEETARRSTGTAIYLGYVVRWIDAGVGVLQGAADIHDVALMEDAILRIAASCWPTGCAMQ